MEAEAVSTNHNGHIEGQLEGQMANAPMPEASAKVSLEMAMLKERLEKMQQGLNTLKAEQDMLEKRLTETSDNILRTEGALVMLGSIIETAGGGAGNGN